MFYFQNCLSKCAILINSSDLERIATTLTRAQEDRAARIIQSFWRTILAARKWAKMRRGFRLFQVYRNEIHSRSHLTNFSLLITVKNKIIFGKTF